MELFLKEISFHGVMLDALFYGCKEEKKMMRAGVQDLLDKGAAKPLVRTVFEQDQLEHVFRYMGAGKHIGKVLLRVRPEEKEIVFKPEPINMIAYPRISFDEKSTCIVCGKSFFFI